ncbi:MAG: lysyl oxidase family protein [Actinomycetota bacterium]
MKIRSVLAALTFAAAAIATVPAGAAVGTLTPTNQTVTWSDEVDDGFINPLLLVSPAPEIRCLQAGACDEFTLTVALGDNFWTKDGAVEVAIRWAYDGVMDLDLQVLDAGGDVVAQSVAVDSNAENVFIPNAADGDYTVRVIPENTFNPDRTEEGPIAYEALAQVEILAADPPGLGHELLPNLVPDPPDGFHVSSALNLIPFPENPLLSCYVEETVENPGHPTRCLRFNQTIANVGAGPMLMRFALSGIVTPDVKDNRIFQRIVSSDGSFREELVPENYIFHKAHAHLHFQGFGGTILYPWDAENGRGAEPAALGRKVGFCMIDVKMTNAAWGATGNGPRSHTFPFSCVLPDEIDPSAPEAWVEQGIAVGWSDVYGWNLADQYIDITNVADGTYQLVQIANPNRSIIEGTTDNSDPFADNCTYRNIEIKGDVVTPIGDGGPIACPA